MCGRWLSHAVRWGWRAQGEVRRRSRGPPASPARPSCGGKPAGSAGSSCLAARVHALPAAAAARRGATPPGRLVPARPGPARRPPPAPAPLPGPDPTKLSKRKHQIGSLYHLAKQKELEQLEVRAQGVKSKAESQRKYGW